MRDLYVSLSNGKYSLAGVTEDTTERMTTRMLVLFLSQLVNDRGSVFVSELVARRLKTSADVVAAFAITALDIRTKMRTLAEDVYPENVYLDSYEFLSETSVKLDIVIDTSLGDITTTVEVTA